MSFKLTWRGKQTKQEVLDKVVKPALTEFGLRVETSAKSKLKKSFQDSKGKYIRGGGRGKRDGTLQRSIHIADGHYNFSTDNSEDVGELGGRDVQPSRIGEKWVLRIGSGLEYAIYVHEIHYNPDVKGFIRRSVDDTRPSLPGILAKYSGGRR